MVGKLTRAFRANQLIAPARMRASARDRAVPPRRILAGVVLEIRRSEEVDGLPASGPWTKGSLCSGILAHPASRPLRVLRAEHRCRAL